MYQNRIAASNDTLHQQTRDTASTYLNFAIGAIDERLGEGEALKHPDLIAAFMRCCAEDFRTGIIGRTLQDGLEAIAAALTREHDRPA